MLKLVAKRYAKALMDGSNDKKIDAYISSLDGIASALSTPKAKEIISSPLVSSTEKVSWIVDALGKKSDPILVKLVEIMGEKGRLGLIPELTSILKFEQKKKSNSFEGTVESRNPLSDKQLEKLEKALSVHSGAVIKLNQEKSDLNGVKVEVEDLGLELNFSKDRVKASLLDYIQKAL